MKAKFDWQLDWCKPSYPSTTWLWVLNASVIGKMILKVKIVSDNSVARLDYIWKILAANFLTKAAKIFGDFFFGCFLKMALF